MEANIKLDHERISSFDCHSMSIIFLKQLTNPVPSVLGADMFMIRFTTYEKCNKIWTGLFRIYVCLPEIE
jgi:hypothetical protein